MGEGRGPGKRKRMRPRDVLWVLAVLLIAALVALTLRGFAQTALVLGDGVTLFGLALEISYLIRRRPTRVLAHRRRLDWHVRMQLVTIAVGSTGLGVLGNGSALRPSSPVVEALVIGVVVAASSIYVSSLVDWYWIMPKIGGMTRSGLIPCVDPGGETWSNMTGLWHFHRAAATALVTAVLAAVPGYLAGRTGTGGTESAAWVLVGSVLAIGYNAVSSGMIASFGQSLNPAVRVGDVHWIRARVREEELTQAYVVDVSTQGVKYKLRRDVDADDPVFQTKGLSMSFDELRRTDPIDDPEPFCPHVTQCRAANWYCFRNVNAHHTLDRTAKAPIPYDVDADKQFG